MKVYLHICKSRCHHSIYNQKLARQIQISRFHIPSLARNGNLSDAAGTFAALHSDRRVPWYEHHRAICYLSTVSVYLQSKLVAPSRWRTKCLERNVTTTSAVVRTNNIVRNQPRKDGQSTPKDTEGKWFPPEHIHALVTCHPGLESVLEQELRNLGIAHTTKSQGALLHGATLETLLQCRLHLGSASQISIQCGQPFSARALGELKRKVSNMPWADLLEKDVHLDVKVETSKSRLIHSTAVKQRVVEGIRAALGTSDNQEGCAVSVRVTVNRDVVELWLDASATPMHRRGYRLEAAKAPLREDLSYALVYSTGWLQSIRQSEMMDCDAMILDPFCGAGTIAIEAVALLLDLAPGRLLPPPFVGTTLSSKKKWQKMVKQSQQQASARKPAARVVASDRDRGAIASAKSNAERAGVSEFIQFESYALSSQPVLENLSTVPDRLLVITNPPFGKRLNGGHGAGRVPPLLPLFQTLDNRLSVLAGKGCKVTAMVLTNDARTVRRGISSHHLQALMRTNHGGIAVCGLSCSFEGTSGMTTLLKTPKVAAGAIQV